MLQFCLIFIDVYISMESIIMNQDPRQPQWTPPPQQYPPYPNQPPAYTPPYQQQPPAYPPQQPGYYPPPQYRPPMPQPPKKTLSPRTILLIVIACAIIAGIGAISNALNPKAKKAAPTPTAQVQQTAQATTAPTKAPTPTPTVVLSIEERVTNILKENGADMQYSAYMVDTKSVSANKQIGAQWDNNTARDSIKMDCYKLQRALWTAQPSLELTSVTVFLKGDVIDAYGVEKNEQVGACTLKQATEDKFNWENLTWKTAWDVYDNRYVAPFLQQ